MAFNVRFNLFLKVIMYKKEKNYAFIDSQNLNLGVKSLGWSLDYKKFRVYLAEKYGVAIAYLFIGFIPQNQDLYSALQKHGYILKFKPVLPSKDGSALREQRRILGRVS